MHRAANCPDGTAVTVSGTVVKKADGTELLCDSNIATDDCLTIDGAAPAGLPPPVSGEVVYTGTVAGHHLRIGPPLPDEVPAASPTVLKPSP